MDAREQGAGIVLLSERKDRVTAADAGLVLMPAAGKRLFPQTGPQPQLYPMWPCPASRFIRLSNRYCSPAEAQCAGRKKLLDNALDCAIIARRQRAYNRRYKAG